MKIQEYRTVAEISLEGLDVTVNELIRAGYQPFGNPYTISNVKGRKENFVACQAMIRFAEALDEIPAETETAPAETETAPAETGTETVEADFALE